MVTIRKLIGYVHTGVLSILSVLGAGLTLGYTADAQAAVACARTVTADVVAIDQPIMFNRIGAQNVNFMVYALRRDVVNKTTNLPLTAGGAAEPGNVALRPDKRPRPLTLRVAAGDCLQVNFQNLLSETPNPFNAANPVMQIDNQVAGRMASFHPFGLELANSIEDDGSFVGKNTSSLVAPGGSRTYTFHAPKEGAFMAYSYGASFGGEGLNGNVGVGLFGVVNVQPVGARMYRSLLTDEELRLATVKDAVTGEPKMTPTGQPRIDYEARYPDDCATNGVWCQEGKAGLPIVNMVDVNDNNKIVHSEIDAIIAGPNSDGSFPASTYPLESIGKRNPTVPNRLEAFREFTVVFHDDMGAAQAYPMWYNDPVLMHTLHGVRDAFMINYGSGGIGSEIISNRLGVGPMHDCLSCAYEEFFLTAYTVGDVGQLVDVPANAGLEACTPALTGCAAVGPKATEAFYPSDPSNVHHSYTGDFVKFRNLHAGPKEQHVFHLHNHQWLFNPNDDNANYLDAQGIGPGSGYTYEINFGGSGNRNKTTGDAIFHCHFYPHFAQGMWEMWRNHDVTETGTVLAVSGGTADAPGFHTAPFALQSGLPAAGSRALPDGEIIAGTPIPAVVPLPGKAMAPMPGKVQVVAKDANGDGIPESSQAQVIERNVNPGFPFWIAGIEHTVGQRPPTPPLDMITEAEAEALKASGDPLWAHMTAANAGGWDGGLPRHTVEGYAAGGTSIQAQNRLDFSKEITMARPQYFPEAGTDVEQTAMRFHAQREHDSTAVNMDGSIIATKYITNGGLPTPSAPYNEPCLDDNGIPFLQGQNGNFFSADGGKNTIGSPEFGLMNPRVYKGANVQFDAVINKVGNHFPQQRIVALWEDVMPTIEKQRPPEPLVMRLNTYDCAKYLHTNLVPKHYELDDYQVRTPTDIIGQHIHLPKWDLTSADGSGNGWNYEDGTLSPGMVQERIHAINLYNDSVPADQRILSGKENAAGHLVALDHPYFGQFANPHWKGARTTIQRWFADPVVNVEGEDRGLGIIFTHDHYGPSTHQQVGLYSTVLIEPAKSKWVHNETGTPMHTRADGGPTSWQAQILQDTDGDNVADTGWREFYFEYGDFQHAYQKGIYVGAGPNGEPLNEGFVPVDAAGNPVAPDILAPDGVTTIAGNQTYRYSINPSMKELINNVNDPDILLFPDTCLGGVPRPCAEAISADDPGMYVVNYRNEPIGLRVYDPAKTGPDGKPGMQADGLAGDLAYAFQTRIDRMIPQLNTVLGDTPYPPLTGGLLPGDPFTPMIRAYAGDQIKVKIQSGSTEEEHVASLHGLKWLQGGSGHGRAPNSGWRNSQEAGISEQFTFDMPMGYDPQAKGTADYLYQMNTSSEGLWTGMWGIIRGYTAAQADLAVLPNNTNPKPGRITNKADFDGVCPITAPVRNLTVIAATANEIFGNAVGATLVPADGSANSHVGGAIDPAGGTLVLNPRQTQIRTLTVFDEELGQTVTIGGQSGPLHDPTALVYVMAEDLEPVPGQKGNACADNARTGKPGVANPGCAVRIRADAPVEPLIVRAAAGDCIKATLYNRITGLAPDLYNQNPILPVVPRDAFGVAGMTSFNTNLFRPSSHAGLHPQLVEYDMTHDDGANVGINVPSTVGPVVAGKNDKAVTYTWYAGHLTTSPDPAGTGNDVILSATPVEFGGFNIMPADKIKQGSKGMVGAGAIVPQGASFPTALADLELKRDHQTADVNATRPTRTMATVTNTDGSTFRDLVAVFQKGQHHRFGDGSLVPNFDAQEAEDAGQMAINYGSEPMWFRFGYPANSPFGLAGLGGITNSDQAYSNTCCTGADTAIGDPVTPVFTAPAGSPVKMRVVLGHSPARGTTFTLHGHPWQRAPYVADAVPSQHIGDNWLGMVLGAQESVIATAHFDIVPVNGAGGAGEVPGDYLFRDMGGFGNTSGLWGILRVDAPAQ